MKIEKINNQTVITLNEMETTVLFITIEQKSASAKKSISRMAEKKIDYKNKFAKIRNKILIDWQDSIDKYIQDESTESINSLYKSSCER